MSNNQLKPLTEDTIEQLQFQQERFQRVIEASNTGIWEWNLKTNEVYYSPRWKGILGYQDHELENSFETWQENLHPEDQERMFQAVTDFIKNPEGNFEQEFRMKHKDGHYVWILNRSAVALDKDGHTHFMSGSHLDISTKKQIEEEIAKTNKKFRDFFEHSPLGKSITSIDGKLSINKRFSEIVGYSEEELSQKNWKEITVKEDIPGSEAAIQEMLQSKNPVTFKKRYIHKDGHIVWTQVRSFAQRDKDGKPIQFLTTVNDITEDLKIEQELKDSESRFRSLFHSVTIPLCFVDNDKKIQLLNQKFTKAFGYTIEDIPSEEIWYQKAYPDPDYREWATKTWLEAFLQAEKDKTDIKSLDYKVVCKDGSVKMVNIGGFPLKDGFLVTLMDITERHQAELKLKESESRFKFLIQSLTIPLCQLDNDGNFIWMNDQFTKKFGYSVDEMPHIDQWWVRAYPDEEYRKWVINNWNGAVEYAHKNKTDIKSDEYIVNCKDGTDKVIIIGGLTLENGLMATFIDVTEIKHAQEKLKTANIQLLNSNKELEQFAYVASHDLQEPLRKVKNYMELFESRYSEAFDDRAKKYLHIVTSGVERMQNLIDDLLHLSRVSTKGKDFEPVDLNDVMKHVTDTLELKIKERNALVNYPNLPVVQADAMQLIQLFQNLLSNAIKYNQNQPEIKIDIKSKHGFWQINVQDNGIGFDKQFSERIFVAFQRLHARDEYEGSGIGLAVCKKIVERHGGEISATSISGQGSTFNFTLPKSKKSK